MADADEREPEGKKPKPKKPLVDTIRDWLDNQGYPLEMRATRTFREAACSRVEQSTFYDSGGTWREIDVAAQYYSNFYFPLDPNDLNEQRELRYVWFDFLYVCECKSQVSKPWLVFTDHSADPTDYPFGRSQVTSPLGGMWFEMMVFPFVRTAPAHFQPRRFGYAATCALGSDNGRENNLDFAYKAITKVLDAARVKSQVTSEQYDILRIVIPIVVITAPLFECYLDEAGNVQLDPQEEMAVLWRNPGVGIDEAIVYIVRETALRAFIDRANMAHYTFSENYRDEMMSAVRTDVRAKQLQKAQEQLRAAEEKQARRRALAKRKRRTRKRLGLVPK